MASSNVYCQLDDVKGSMGIDAGDLGDDALITQKIEAVSRAIDEYCNRRFYVVAAEIRYFTARRSGELLVGDFTTITLLRTDRDGDRTYETTWTITGAAADVDFEPFENSLESKPYWRLLTTPNGRYGFPVGIRRGVEITGSFGYSTLANLPPQIREAAILQTVRLHRRKEQPFGVYAMPAAGIATFISALDPDVKTLLAPFVLAVVA